MAAMNMKTMKPNKTPRLILAFVRHAEYEQRPNTPSASQPFALNEIGKNHSQAIAQQVSDFAQQQQLKVHPAIHSSNLLRAWQTAKIIKDTITQPCHIETSSRLNERSVGSVANLSVNEIEQILEQDPRYECPDFNWKSDSYYCLPFDGAESLMQSGERLANFIRKEFIELRQNAQQDTLKIMVGHGASFRHAAYLLGIIDFDDIARYSMYHATPLFFEFNPARNPQGWRFAKIAGDWKTRAIDNNKHWLD